MSGIKRGGIYWTELSPTVGSEQRGIRPTLVIQNDIGNKFGLTVIVAILTKRQKKDLPTHVLLKRSVYNLEEDSVVMLEQIRTIDKFRIGDNITFVDSEKMKEIDEKIITSLAINIEALKSIG